ncbi:MFS general substrate transporter [Pleurotus eryngii]|uniref:MFS general substrate transporter n=1 Tax=Pleurotus eryngii TaxID=5323 RepID=A0A9P6DB75_PLEER|nr:MFS general substrate transporter [Pleurotus eryngii]
MTLVPHKLHSSDIWRPIFYNHFLRSGVTNDERKVGYYAEFVTELFWSCLSDRIGRKLVLLAGMVGLFVTILSASLSGGAFNGNVDAVVKNVMVEITDSSNIADAFSFLPPVWTMGSTFGFLIGRLLANPGSRWPDAFGKTPFFIEYPYVLPCATASFFAFLCAIVGTIFLKELSAEDFIHLATHPTKLAEKGRKSNLAAASSRNYGSIHNDSVVESPAEATTSTDTNPPSIRSVLVRPIVISLTTHAFAVIVESFRTLLPLILLTSIPLGGLALSSAHIGTITAIWARLLRKFGPKKTFVISYGSYAICLALDPRSNGLDANVICVLVVQLSYSTLAAMSYDITHQRTGSNQLFIIAAVPGQNSLATVNGLAQMVSSIMRSLAPSTSSSLFSLSVEHNMFSGYLVYLIIVLAVMAGLYAASGLPDIIEDG